MITEGYKIDMGDQERFDEYAKTETGSWRRPGVAPPGFIADGRDHGTSRFTRSHYPTKRSMKSSQATSWSISHTGAKTDRSQGMGRCLKKGGKLKIAVPDFEKIAKTTWRANRSRTSRTFSAVSRTITTITRRCLTAIDCAGCSLAPVLF
jgi:hypothetical protein